MDDSETPASKPIKVTTYRRKVGEQLETHPFTPDPLIKLLPQRKRDSVATADSEVESKEESMHASAKKSPTTKRSAPKKVDVYLPPPSPKRSRFAPDSEVESDTNNTVIKPSSKLHTSKSASVSSVDVNKLKTAPATPKVKGPSSNISKTPKSKSVLKPSSPSISEDEKSVMEKSAHKHQVHRSEAQRIQFLKDHPDCGRFEAHKALCTRCNKLVTLSGQQTYPLFSWNKHVEKCKQRVTEPSPKFDDNDNAEADSEDDKASVSPSSAQDTTPKTKLKNENERRAYLESDPRILEIKDYEVQCKNCQRWIKLGTARKYMLYRWDQHRARCSGAVPSGRVATANRKLQLVNDSLAKSFTTQSVECASCYNTIVLDGEGEYNLTKWQAHKAICPKSTPSEIAQSSPATRPPASVASTDVTVVAPDSSSVSQKGEKRPREADEQEDAVTDGRNVRARTESYVPPKGNIYTSIWDWVTLPLKTFVRGFKEGLGTQEVPAPAV